MKKHREVIFEYEAIFDPNGGGYTVTVPKLPGVVTEGDTLKEAREMVKDAIRCYLGALLKEQMLLPSQKVFSERKTMKVFA